MSVEIKLGTTTPEIGSVKSLFTVPYMTGGYATNSDIFQVTPDGQRFLIASAPEIQNASPVTLVVNWPGEIKQK
jgi:hypothetical protein